MTLRNALQNALSICGALVFSLSIHSAVAASYTVPSASMEPTLMIGDHIGVVIPQYGCSTANLPFGNLLHSPEGGNSRLFGHMPSRGDVIVFRAPASPKDTWVKRVIGLPGDRIELRGGRVLINGTMLPWKDEGTFREESSKGIWQTAEQYDETLPGNHHHKILKMQENGQLDDIAPFTVPSGRLFVMGDNRDNSADSRVPVSDGGVGLLPLWNVTGRAIEVLWSWHHPTRVIISLA